MYRGDDGDITNIVCDDDVALAVEGSIVEGFLPLFVDLLYTTEQGSSTAPNSRVWSASELGKREPDIHEGTEKLGRPGSIAMGLFNSINDVITVNLQNLTPLKIYVQSPSMEDLEVVLDNFSKSIFGEQVTDIMQLNESELNDLGKILRTAIPKAIQNGLLLQAVCQGNEKLVKAFLAGEADSNACEESELRETALHLATIGAHQRSWRCCSLQMHIPTSKMELAKLRCTKH